MGKKHLMTGKKYNHWLVLSEMRGSQANPAKVLCLCDCGKKKIVIRRDVLFGQSKCCGCLRSWSHVRTHGMSNAPEYRIWNEINKRCHNVSCKKYKNYGARGIKVCSRWHDFANFYSDMGPRPSLQHSIDRIDVNGDYSPENCRWSTPKAQARNKTNTVFVEFLGEKKSLGEWCEIYGMRTNTVLGRLKLGWPIEKALTTPSLRSKTKRGAQQIVAMI